MLTPEQVDRIALLARLDITPDERALYARQLSSILAYAEQLATVDVSDVPPTTSVLPVHSVMRSADVARPGYARDAMLKNAPRSDGEQFEVPAVLSEDN
jgi:aspartyl-tRNA(Asn)/glutamyl-tRNA(Gln) amidotransferase subunit C